MGKIVGAALVSHHPGLMQKDDFRIQAGAGADSDLIAGYGRLRAKIDAAAPDIVIIFDTHWLTTGYHLVDAAAHYSGTYVSEEMPWYLNGLKFDYDGAPALGQLIQTVAEENGVMARAIDDPLLPRQYATLNVVKHLQLKEKVLTVGNCQNCQTHHFLEMGAAIGEAIRRSDARVVLLASGALSHKFNEIDWQQKNPRIYHPENVSSPKNIESDLEAVALLRDGRHDIIIDRFPTVYRKIPWEGLGGHYLQMAGAMGGRNWSGHGEVLSEYENARGTGNIHVWFEEQK